MVHTQGGNKGARRQHSVTCNSAALEKTGASLLLNPKPSYDSKDDTIYMQTIACGNLSKEETMEVSSDRVCVCVFPLLLSTECLSVCVPLQHCRADVCLGV